MADGTVRVLLIEDDEDDYILTRDLLQEIGSRPYALDWADSYDAGLEAIGRDGHDVYLLDYRLGARSGMDLLREAVARGCRRPLILLTGKGDHEVDVEAMRAGAADYLTKDRMDVPMLERTIRYAIERKRAEDELRGMRDELEDRVRERTAELSRANEALQAEVAFRRRAEAERAELLEREQRARAEAEEASRAKDQFLAALSHELRNPLNPVLLEVTDRLGDPATPAALRPGLEMIRRNIELEARLIDDLLDVMRIIRGKLPYHWGTADAHPLVWRTLEMFRDQIEAGDLRLQAELTAEESSVCCDEARLHQVFWNLIRNAIKFSPSGGPLSVRSRNEPDPGDPEGRPRLVVEVADRGIGIAPGALPRIFNAFEQGEDSITRRFGGLGLGLAISRTIVESHGGLLTASSPGPGLGATFRVALPTVPARAPEPEGEPGDLAPRGALLPVPSLRILLVEDDAFTLRIMARLLRQCGHNVTTADGVAPALEAAEADGFDLVISDLGLPDASGLELMSRIREKDPAIRGIALSGYGTEDDLRRSRDAGYATHLTKPIDFPKLDAAIRQVVQGPEPAGVAP